MTKRIVDTGNPLAELILSVLKREGLIDQNATEVTLSVTEDAVDIAYDTPTRTDTTSIRTHHPRLR